MEHPSTPAGAEWFRSRVRRAACCAPELLDGTTLAFAGGADHVADACGRLGARLRVVDAPLLDEVAVAEVGRGARRGRRRWSATRRRRSPRPAAGSRACAPASTAPGTPTRAVVNARLARGRRPAGGKVVLLGPRPRDGAHAGALGAALENTARTLSIEWARHGIRTTAIRPGDATPDDEIAELVAYLVSPAGDYFSGCAFALR